MTGVHDAADEINDLERLLARAERLDGQPGVVIGAVRAVVRAARGHTNLPSCRRLFTGPAVRCRD